MKQLHIRNIIFEFFMFIEKHLLNSYILRTFVLYHILLKYSILLNNFFNLFPIKIPLKVYNSFLLVFTLRGKVHLHPLFKCFLFIFYYLMYIQKDLVLQHHRL